MKGYLLFLLLIGWGGVIVTTAPASAKSVLPVIGAVETLVLEKEKMHFPARIDTGAQTSSLSAVNIERFERDGKKWLRFEVKNPVTDEQVKLERPLKRTVEIKRHGAPPAARPVVSLLVSIGKIRQQCEFTLVDRSSYTYPALIGRNFLSGKAMVDVSREHTVHPVNQPEKNTK